MGGSVSRSNIVETTNKYMDIAANPGKRVWLRCAALRELEQLCHVQKDDIGTTCQRVLAENSSVGRLLEIVGSEHPQVSRCARSLLVTVSYTTVRDIKITIGRRLLEDMMEELLQYETMSASDLKYTVQVMAHVCSEDTCRMQVHRGVSKGGRGGVPELVALLNHKDTGVQLAALEALVALSERHDVRIQIMKQDGLLPITGLCFVNTLYGATRHQALRLLGNMTKEPEVRTRIGEQAVLFRLAQACRKARGTYPRSLLLLIASVYCNFSQHEDLSAAQADDAMAMLYHLVFSDDIDFVIQGLWGIANYLQDASMRREFIETDGLKLLFSVLGESGSEVQIWFEVSRAILAIASGGVQRNVGRFGSPLRSPASRGFTREGTTGSEAKPDIGEIDSTGTDQEKEFLIREGALEALVGVYAWCMEDRGRANKPNEIQTGPAELDEIPPEDQGSVYDEHGEDIERSARYLCMTVVTHALKHLTTFGFVCQMLCDLGGTKAVMQTLRADFDTEGQEHAAAVVGNMARHQEPCRVVVVEDDVIGTLVDLLKYSSHELVHLQASYALANIGKMSGLYQKIIIDSGGVAGLVSVIKRDCPERTAKNVIRALAMLSTNEAKFEMMSSDGLPHIIKFCDTTDIDLRVACAAALRNLSEMANDAHHLVMVRDGVIGALVRMLEDDHPVMNREAAHALSILTSRMESNKVALVEQDGLRAVARHLSSDNDDLLVHILATLGNLGTVQGIAQEMSKMRLIIRQLCYVLQMDKFPLTLQAMRCLVNSTQDEADSSIALSLIPAQAFVDMLESPNATLQRHAAHVLANLAMWQCNWPHLRKVGVVKVLTKYMRSENFDVVIQSVRCLAHLMQDRECHQDMERYSMVTVLSEVAKKSVIVLDEQQEADDLSSYVAMRNLRMQEQVMAAMRLTSKHPPSAVSLVDDHQCIDVFLRLLRVPSIDVRRETAGCLANIAAVPHLCEQIVEEGGMDHIMSCLATSVHITRELVADIAALRERLEHDARAKESISAKKKLLGAYAPIEQARPGLSYEEREHMMTELDQKIRFSAQNSKLQEYCLECIYHFAADNENRKALLDAYDWDSFMAPLHLPEEAQALDCTIMASRACFTLLHAKQKLYRFMELHGIRYVLRALQLDDAEVKYLAAEALGILSQADEFAFQRAIELEGGVKTIMRLTESTHRKIRAQAFHAVAQLCNNKELGAMFVAQNILVSISSYSTKVKHQPRILMRLIQIVASLASNERSRWKVLERGGATLLLKSIVHYDVNVARLAAATLARLVAGSESDLREAITRNKMSSNLMLCVEQSPFPEALRDVLYTLALVTEREAYREKAVTDSLADNLLMLCDDQLREERLRERLLENDARMQEEVAEYKKRLEQDEDRYKYEDPPDADEAGEDGVVDGLNRGRAGRDVLEAAAANALQVFNNLLLVQRELEYVTSNESALLAVMKAANPNGAAPRLAQACRAIQQCVARKECHQLAVEIGVLGKLASLSRTQNVEAKRHIATSLQLLAANPAMRVYFADERIVAGLKSLSQSKMREVQLSCSATLRDLTLAPDFARLCTRAGIIAELLLFLDHEHDTLKLDAMQCIMQLCPYYTEWYDAPEPKADEQAATEALSPGVSTIMAVFRLALQRSVLGNTALQTLCKILAVHPESLCPFVDSTSVLDLKKTCLQRSRDAGRGVTYTGEMGKSSCDLHAYIKSGGDLAGRLESAEPRVHAARALCCMTTIGADGGPRVAVLRSLGVDDMMRHAADEANDTRDPRYLVLMLRMVGNCAQRPAQRYKLADDRSGLLKVLLDMTTHINPHVVQAAFYCLANIAEEPVSHHRLLALCPLEHLAAALGAYVQDTLDVETLSSARHQAPDLAHGLARLFSSIVCELCRLMANLSDGGPAAHRSLREAHLTLTASVAQLPGHIPKDIRWHVYATLARSDGKEPQPVHGLQATFDSLVAAAKDRVDAARVQKGVHALATLCRDHDNHQELAAAGAVEALVGALRNPLPDIFVKACWALCFLLLHGERVMLADPEATRGTTSKERERLAEGRCQFVATLRERMFADDCRGLVPAMRSALDGKIPAECRHSASKLVSLLLRDPQMARALQRNAQPPRLTMYVMPSF
eukprot:TRINITY_DN50409_c0_g1_i1.p1 TRINITY_DN50409_c0_g1~~TRINITY_DN50409_c0_g1_i1.p1  ORF type:complete len:2119 (+),score=810.66 TRINITY_DN50409_c0_g1_i1:102-6458(+)